MLSLSILLKKQLTADTGDAAQATDAQVGASAVLAVCVCASAGSMAGW